jgi:hypothetical protein
VTLDTLAAGAAIAIPVLLTLSYVYNCYAHPFAEHRRCHGTGRIPYLFGRGWRFCPRCQGTGLRLRIGRRLWNHARRLQREAAQREDRST